MSPETKSATLMSPGGPEMVPGYPSLSNEALGALKLIWRYANIEDDWRKGGRVSDAWDRWTGWPYMAKFTYNLTYAIRALAKMSQEIPAWREVLSQAADLINARMYQYVSWYDWVEQAGLDPNRASYPYLYYKCTIPPGMAGVYNAPGYCGNGLATAMDGLAQSFVWAPVQSIRSQHPYLHQHSPGVGRKYNPDPVYANGSSNMMYKGYLLEQLGHCRVISGDAKYDAPREMVYDDTIRYTYSADQIAAVLCEQYRSPVDENGSGLRFGIDCEVGKVFPICNSVGGLGMLLHDRIHGTSYADAYREWQDYAKDTIICGGTDPNAPIEWCPAYYDRDINYLMTRPEQQFPLFWTSTALQVSPFDRALAERLYEGALHRYGRLEPDGGLHIILGKEIVGDAILDDTWGQVAAIACAHEFGDTERLEQFRTYFANRYEPTYHDGEFYYQFGIREPWPRGIPNHWVQLTFMGEAGSFRRMYVEPNLSKFDQPTVCGIDYPNLTVRQAYYDEAKGALAIAITPGHDAAPTGSTTSFRVRNLRGDTPTVQQDGDESTAWRLVGPGEIEIRTTVGGHTFLIS
jgi:Linalool dehydratase/isomerase